MQLLKKAKSDNDRWTEELINEKKVRFGIDTGADCNVVSAKTFQALKLDNELHASRCRLVAYSGHKMEPLCKTSLTCQYKGQAHQIDFEIVERDAPALVGNSWS